jgi:phosphoglycolate phosphatase-like HAD superfamily hydrolase
MASPLKHGLDIGRIQAICFDIDGTLADTDDAYVQLAARWMSPFQRLLRGGDPVVVARRLVMAIETPANNLIAWLDRFHLDQVLGPAINVLYRLRGASATPHLDLVPGAREALQRLVGHFPLAICTAREQASTQAFLTLQKLAPFFFCVATARSARRAKPHPAPVIWVCEQLEISPRSLLMVGDTVVDILAGRRAGAQTVGLLCGFGKRDELQMAGADLILDGPAELVNSLLL